LVSQVCLFSEHEIKKWFQLPSHYHQFATAFLYGVGFLCLHYNDFINGIEATFILLCFWVRNDHQYSQQAQFFVFFMLHSFLFRVESKKYPSKFSLGSTEAPLRTFSCFYCYENMLSTK